MTRHTTTALAALLLLTLFPSSAWADATAFLGFSSTPTRRTAKGFAVAVSLVIIGFEYEYNNTSEDEANAAPKVKTHMGNVLLQTPTGRAQLYFTVGTGYYQETFRTFETSGVGTNIGGGIKITLAGPIRLRMDYRIFHFHGEPLYPTPKRFYGGVVLAF